MPLSDDEKKLLEELTAKSKEPDSSDAFEIEIYDTTAGKGARIPFGHGKKWLWENFGLGEDPNPPAEGGDSDKDKGNVKPGYFGRGAQKPPGGKTA
jgi:hypothetical protein